MLYVFLFDSIGEPVIDLLNPWYLWKLRNRRHMEKQGRKSLHTQREANKLFEGEEFDIAEQSANVVKTMQFMAFYAQVYPAGVLLTLIGLCVRLVIDRYLIARRYARPMRFGAEINNAMRYQLLSIPFFMALGGTIFMRIANKELDFGGNEIALLFYGVYFYNPFLSFIRSACFQRFCGGRTEKTLCFTKYDDVKHKFDDDYDLSNPVTHRRAMIAFMQHNLSKLKNKEEKIDAVKAIEKLKAEQTDEF